MSPVKIVHYSDVLCVWAYVGQRNLFAMVEEFGDRLEVETRYCSVFPDSHSKIATQWKERAGFDGYADHVQDVVDGFDGFDLHKDAWRAARPRSSASPHLFLKAVELLDDGAGTPFADKPAVRAARELRTAFFEQAMDIANWSAQAEISKRIGFRFDRVLEKIETGEAIAALTADYDQARSLAVQGSPTFILNEGRQRLFGNIGYGILAANIKELLSHAENTDPCAHC